MVMVKSKGSSKNKIKTQVLGKEVILTTVTENLSWSAVLLKVNKGLLSAKSIYQRDLVWTKKEKEYFIDSCSRGVPIPEILVRKLVIRDLKTGTRKVYYEIVDGQQRVRCIYEFLTDKILMPKSLCFGDESLFPEKYSRSKFSRLPSAIKDQFNDYSFSFKIIQGIEESSDALSHLTCADVYSRRNASGSLKVSEKLFAKVGSALRNVAVSMAEPEIFDIKNGLGKIKNENYHPFFGLTPLKNSRKEHTVLAISLLQCLDHKYGGKNNNVNHLTLYVDRYKADALGLNTTHSGGRDLMKSKFTRETLAMLDDMYLIFNVKGGFASKKDKKKQMRVLGSRPYLKTLCFFLQECKGIYKWDKRFKEVFRNFAEGYFEKIYPNKKTKLNQTVKEKSLHSRYHINRHETAKEFNDRADLCRSEFKKYIKSKRLAKV